MNTPSNDKIDITVVLDKSGSMGSCLDATLEGFNSFLREQQSAPGEARLTLIQFHTQAETICRGIPIREASPLTRETYVPGGGTALLDAMGSAINTARTEIASLVETERPSRVVFVIITDGEENQSHEFKRDQVFKMIEDAKAKDNWQFLFLGANQDAIQAGGQVGVSFANAANFSNTHKGIISAYSATSSNIRTYRASSDTADLQYSTLQRASMMDPSAAGGSTAGDAPSQP